MWTDIIERVRISQIDSRRRGTAARSAVLYLYLTARSFSFHYDAHCIWIWIWIWIRTRNFLCVCVALLAFLTCENYEFFLKKKCDVPRQNRNWQATTSLRPMSMYLNVQFFFYVCIAFDAFVVLLWWLTNIHGKKI